MPRLPAGQRVAFSTRAQAGQDIFIVGAARTPMGGFRSEEFLVTWFRYIGWGQQMGRVCLAQPLGRYRFSIDFAQWL